MKRELSQRPTSSRLPSKSQDRARDKSPFEQGAEEVGSGINISVISDHSGSREN